MQADCKTLKHRVEREGEEEHEGAKGRVSLKVHMDMMSAALQVRACSVAVTVAVAVSVVLYEGRPLLLSPSSVPTVQDNPLHYEDHEEADSHDELWERETGLFETDGERFISLHNPIKSRITYMDIVCMI